jgi:heat shock protein HslJ
MRRSQSRLAVIGVFLCITWGAAAWAGPPDTRLTETYWKAVEIGGAPVSVEPRQREPHLVFSVQGNRVHGSTGCNRLTGAFEHHDDTLSFKGVAVTKMACPPPISTQEAAFLQALGATQGLHITGDVLELKDASGKVLMRLKAVYLR